MGRGLYVVCTYRYSIIQASIYWTFEPWQEQLIPVLEIQHNGFTGSLFIAIFRRDAPCFDSRYECVIRLAFIRLPCNLIKIDVTNQRNAHFEFKSKSRNESFYWVKASWNAFSDGLPLPQHPSAPQGTCCCGSIWITFSFNHKMRAIKTLCPSRATCCSRVIPWRCYEQKRGVQQCCSSRQSSSNGKSNPSNGNAR